MPTFIHTADGVKTVFKCISSALAKSVRVAGKVVVPQSTTTTSVTFAVAPFAGDSVEIMYGEIRTNRDREPGTPVISPRGGGPTGTLGPGGGFIVFGQFPTATVFNTAASIAPPVINYVDATAENVVFTLDPNAATVDVYGAGQVVTILK